MGRTLPGPRTRGGGCSLLTALSPLSGPWPDSPTMKCRGSSQLRSWSMSAGPSGRLGVPQPRPSHPGPPETLQVTKEPARPVLPAHPCSHHPSDPFLVPPTRAGGVQVTSSVWAPGSGTAGDIYPSLGAQRRGHCIQVTASRPGRKGQVELKELE